MRALSLAVSLLLAGCVGSRAEPPAAPLPTPPATPSPPLLTPFRWTGVPTQGGLLLGEAPAGTLSAVLRVAGRPDTPVDLSGGRFLVGFDRDAPASAELVAALADGREVRQPLTVLPRAWRIERVDTPYRAGRTDAEFEALRPGELQRIAAAKAMSVDSYGWQQLFRWPLTGRQTGWFGSQRVYQGKPGSYHSGADIAAPTGTAVRAPADGVVILATDRPFTLEGNLLMLGHGMGLTSAFLHLSRIAVPSGARVRQGEVIAYAGATGRATGPHLHWGLSWRDARLDPLLAAGPVPAG